MLLPVFHFGQASLCLDPGAPFFLARTQLCVRAAPLTFFRRKGGFDAQPIAPSREALFLRYSLPIQTHTHGPLLCSCLSLFPCLSPLPSRHVHSFPNSHDFGAPSPLPLPLSSLVGGFAAAPKGHRAGRQAARNIRRRAGKGAPPPAGPPAVSSAVQWCSLFSRGPVLRSQCTYNPTLFSLLCSPSSPFQTRPDQTPGSVFVGAPLATTTPIPMQTCPPVN